MFIFAILGSHLFRKPELVRAALVEGLSQASVDCMLPRLIVRRNLQEFLRNDLDILFPPDTYLKFIATPARENMETEISIQNKISRISDKLLSHTKVFQNNNDNNNNNEGVMSQGRVVVAIGPEGGWEDSEIELFLHKGFEGMHIGSRILRTDTAV